MENNLKTIEHDQYTEFKMTYHISEVESGWNLTYQMITPDYFGFKNGWINSFLEKGFWKSSQQIETMLKQELDTTTEQLMVKTTFLKSPNEVRGMREVVNHGIVKFDDRLMRGADD